MAPTATAARRCSTSSNGAAMRARRVRSVPRSRCSRGSRPRLSIRHPPDRRPFTGRSEARSERTRRRPPMSKGTITHIEFPADDPARAKRFYAAVAGWDINEVEGFPGYEMFRTEEGHGGGLGKRGETVGTVVRVYITVDKLEESVAAGQANGGPVVPPPT